VKRTGRLLRLANAFMMKLCSFLSYHFCRCRIKSKRDRIHGVKYWEIIADNLSKAGWSWGCVSAIDSNWRTLWVVDAHRDGRGFVVRADELLTAFLEAERAIHQFAVSLLS
jgi:hypothetical protein